MFVKTVYGYIERNQELCTYGKFTVCNLHNLEKCKG